MRSKIHRRAKAAVISWAQEGLIDVRASGIATSRIIDELTKERQNAVEAAREEMNQLAGFPREFIPAILNAIQKG